MMAFVLTDSTAKHILWVYHLVIPAHVELVADRSSSFNIENDIVWC